jgi:hypothetical protein
MLCAALDACKEFLIKELGAARNEPVIDGETSLNEGDPRTLEAPSELCSGALNGLAEMGGVTGDEGIGVRIDW